MNICVIPARGGSKRIPRKNIKSFRGKPMIAWSIEAALESSCFERVVCSTDDEEIADIAKKYGAEVPVFRPKYLSDDHVATIPVISHAIKYLQKGKKIDFVCCIYATAPFIQPEDIISSFAQIKKEDNDYCFSVTSYSFPIQRAIRAIEGKGCEMFQPDNFNRRSQDLEEAYHDAGQFYWGNTQAWLEGKPIFSEEASLYILPRYQVQDIDTIEDWKMAELMFDLLRSKRI